MISVILYDMAGHWRSIMCFVGIQPLFKLRKHGCEDVHGSSHLLKMLFIKFFSPVHRWFADSLVMCGPCSICVGERELCLVI
jgi:hypothetical protein